MTSTLYEQDYHQWLEKTAHLLKNDRLNELDTPNLIEEIEDMGRSQKRAVASNLRITLRHLLKYKYQPERRTSSWRLTLFEHRRRLEEDFADSPSLKNYFYEVFSKCYQDARKEAAIETEMPLMTFPERLPFTPEEVLNLEYLPD